MRPMPDLTDDEKRMLQGEEGTVKETLINCLCASIF